MPVILRRRGYRFEFYSSDAAERAHVHVKKNGKRAKVWLRPVISLEYSRGFRPHEVNEILRLVEQNREPFIEDWDDFFAGPA